MSRPSDRTAAPRWRYAIGGLLCLILSAVAALSQAIAPTTAAYVRQSALTDLFAIDASRLALQRSQSPKVRDFARQTLGDHSRSAARLKRAVSAHVGLSLPTRLDPGRRDELARLTAATDEAFDVAYLRGELQGGRDALDLHRAYAQSGDDPALRRVARQAAPIVQRHLATLELLAQEALTARMCRLRAEPAASITPLG